MTLGSLWTHVDLHRGNKLRSKPPKLCNFVSSQRILFEDPKLPCSSVQLFLKVKYDGTWGTICDDDFDQKDGDVICRQLGFHSASRVYHESWRKFRSSSTKDMPIWIDGIRCTGNEEKLAECDFDPIGRHNCDHRENAGKS